MTCDDLNRDLSDLVDGRLAPSAEREAERHLEACASCRALVADVRTIRAAAFTLDRLEPGAGAWAALQARVAVEPVPRRPSEATTSRATWGVWLAAAAALVLATAIGLAPLWSRGATPAPAAADGATPVTVESVTAEFEAAEQHYQKAIADLQSIADADTGELDPQLAAVLQKNLSVIDQAISENRAALRAQPASRNAQDGLFDGLRTKVALLQQTVELINEMRKGNQTEAGLKFQGLSQ